MDPNAKFTIEIENNNELPSLDIKRINLSSLILERTVYRKIVI